MAEIIVILINVGISFGPILIALIIGYTIEKRHYISIRQREAATMNLPAIPSREWDMDREVADARMVTASVVISIDYFKRFIGGLRNIIGGRIRAFETILDRGRREALLRMKEACPGTDIIVNLRFETSTISKTKQNGKQAVGCIEVVAYGTAIKYAPEV